MKERSLVAFTILSQMAVGAFWTLGALHGWATRQAGLATADTLTDRALLIVGPAMVLGLLASFFHLGNPAEAWRALANLRSSWLSREILFAMLFTGISLFFVGLQWFKVGTLDARNILAWIAAFIGLGLLFCMSSAYEVRTIPAWNTGSTPAFFFATALLLGSLLVGVILAITGTPSELLQTGLKWMALNAILLSSLGLAGIPLWLAQLASGPEAAVRALARITLEHRVLFRWRLGLSMLGILFASIALSPWWQLNNARIGILLAFVVVLISEVLGRLLFYEARVRLGV